MPNNVDGFTPLPAEPGLYDQLIDQQLHDQLAELAQAHLAPDIKKVDPAELPDRVGELVGKWVSRALASVTPDDRAEAAITLSQAVINALTHAEPDSDSSISSLTYFPHILKCTFSDFNNRNVLILSIVSIVWISPQMV